LGLGLSGAGVILTLVFLAVAGSPLAFSGPLFLLVGFLVVVFLVVVFLLETFLPGVFLTAALSLVPFTAGALVFGVMGILSVLGPHS